MTAAATSRKRKTRSDKGKPRKKVAARRSVARKSRARRSRIATPEFRLFTVKGVKIAQVDGKLYELTEIR